MYNKHRESNTAKGRSSKSKGKAPDSCNTLSTMSFGSKAMQEFVNAQGTTKPCSSAPESDIPSHIPSQSVESRTDSIIQIVDTCIIERKSVDFRQIYVHKFNGLEVSILHI